jgi:hypothetical protein
VKLPDSFVGDQIRGAVVISNKTSSPVTINGIKSSCGCTTAYSVENKVLPGQSTKTYVQVRLSEAGAFKGQMLIDLGDRQTEILLNGDVNERISGPASIKIEDGYATAEFKVSDSSIKSPEFKFNRIFESVGELKFRISEANLDAAFKTSVVADIKANEFKTQHRFEVLRPGYCELISREVYLRSENPRMLRLFFRGDVSVLTGVTALKLRGQSSKAILAVKQMGSVGIVEITLPEPIVGFPCPAELVGKLPFQFSILGD